MATAIIGTMLVFSTVSSFSGPSTACPMSFNRISPEALFCTIKLAKSSSVLSLPKVRTVSSVLFPAILPLGSSTFSRARALRTSVGVRP